MSPLSASRTLPGIVRIHRPDVRDVPGILGAPVDGTVVDNAIAVKAAGCHRAVADEVGGRRGRSRSSSQTGGRNACWGKIFSKRGTNSSIVVDDVVDDVSHVAFWSSMTV